MKKNKTTINILTILIVFLFTSFLVKNIYSMNTVLKLDGRDSYVELPSNMLDSLENSTIEGWFKWNSFNYYSQPFGYGSEWNLLALNNEITLNHFQYFMYRNKELSLIKIDGILNLDEWYHIAAVSGQAGMKLYINGLLIGKFDDKKSFSKIKNEQNKFFLGKSHWDINAFFDGEMDEIRVWKTIRTDEEIRSNLFKKLKGNEKGLFALWNFDNSNSDDVTSNGNNGITHNIVQFLSENTPKSYSEMNNITTIEGIVTDEEGTIIHNAKVTLNSLGNLKNIISETNTDEKGYYKIYFIESEKDNNNLYDLYGSKDNTNKLVRKMNLTKGRNNKQNLVLAYGNTISGKISDYYNSPLNSILIQLLKYDYDGSTLNSSKVVQAQLSENNGNYSFYNIEEGKYEIRVVLENDTTYYNENEILLVNGSENIIKDIDITITPQRKGDWKNYKYYDGLNNSDITQIKKGNKGELYFATKSGVYTYNGDNFEFFPDENSVISKKNITSMEIDSEGNYWFGTELEGVYKYDKNGIFIKNYTMADGFNSYYIYYIKETINNEIWAGTFKGINRIDKYGNVILQSEDQKHLKNIYHIRTIATSNDKSEIWVSSLNGIIHYTENKFEFLDIKELQGIIINTIEVDEINNIMYCGSLENGLFIIDIKTKETIRYSTENGLCSNSISDLYYSEKTKTLWISTDNGISRHKNNFLTNFNSSNGLVHNNTNSIFYDDEGNYLLVGTEHGLSTYYEEGFEIFTKNDGLPNNVINSFVIDRKDRLWLTHPKRVSYLNNLENRTTKFSPLPYISGAHRNFLYNNTVLFSDYSYGILAVSTDSLKILFNIDEKDGIVGNIVRAFASIGNEIWFGTQTDGIFCYENDSIKENKFNLKKIILENEQIYTLINDLEFEETNNKYNKEWSVWGGSYNDGIFAINNKDEITNLTIDDGLIHNAINTLYKSRSSNTLWIGTPQGISCLDTETNKFFLPYGIDKLSRNIITSIYEHSDKVTWFGTKNNGLFGFDGTAWMHFDERENIGNRITGIEEDSRKNLWISTDNGLAKLTNNTKFTPKLNIISVTTDSLYYDIQKIPSIIIGKRISILVGMLNLTMNKKDHQYRWRIAEKDNSFGEPVKNSLIEWTPKKTGKFTLEIQGIDKFLNYSDITRIQFNIVNYWYFQDKIFIPATLGVIILFLIATYFIIRFIIQKRVNVKLKKDSLTVEIEKNIELSESLEKLKQAKEEAIKEKEKAELANDLKTNFLANMSHEIRTPLNAVIGFGELLSDKFIDKKEVSYVEAIKVAGKNLLTLINNILDISKIETSKLDIKYSFIDPRILLNEIKDLFAAKCQKKKLKFELLIDPYLPHLLNIDETRIRQILTNIVGNSLKFTYEGFIRVSLSVAGKKNKDDTIDLQISVKDSGIGINDNIIDKIFDPFIQANTQVTRNIGGTGLGLSICKKLVEIMKGEINVSSKVGKGTTFKIILRDIKYTYKQEEAKIDKKQFFKLGEIKFFGGHILIVDNNKTNRLLLKELLSRVNLDVIFARDYGEVISRIKNFNPDLVILDLKDPVIQSEKIAHDLKDSSIDKKIELFALVSTLNDSEVKKYTNIGFHSFIYKPIDIFKLIEKLSQVFDYSLQPKRSEFLHEDNNNNNKLNNSGSISMKDYKFIAKKSIFKDDSLKKIINENLLPAVTELKRSGRMNMTREFGVELQKIGKHYNIPYFNNFGLKLIEKADTFDINSISVIFDELEMLLKNIE